MKDTHSYSCNNYLADKQKRVSFHISLTDNTNKEFDMAYEVVPIADQSTRSDKEKYPPHDHVLLAEGGELKCYAEVVSHKHKE